MFLACRLAAALADPLHSAAALHCGGHIPAIHTTLVLIKRIDFHRVEATCSNIH